MLNEHKKIIRRGDIFYADLSPVVGSEQGGLRPVLILQNNVGNRYSPTVIVAPITSRMEKTEIPTHAPIGRQGKLARESFTLLEQIRTIDKGRLCEKVGWVSQQQMEQVDKALVISVGLHPAFL